MAISKRTLLTGKRVYNGVSQSPNKGQVSGKGSMGYVKRELKKKHSIGDINSGRALGHAHAPGQLKKQGLPGRPIVSPVGSDGKSDRRSNIAALALKRMKSKGK